MAVDGAGRGPYAKSAARREEILRVAYERFTSGGYQATSLRSIAAEAGISHAGLLHHFPTKEALLMAVLEQRDERRRAHFQQAVPSGDLLGQLIRIVEENQTTPELVRLWTTLSAEATGPEHPAHELITARYRRVRSSLADGLRRGQATGRLTPDVDVDRTAATVLAVMDGLQLQWLLDKSVDVSGAMAELLRRYVPDAGGR